MIKEFQVSRRKYYILVCFILSAYTYLFVSIYLHLGQCDDKTDGENLNDTVLTQYSVGSDDATVEVKEKGSNEDNDEIPHNFSLDDSDMSNDCISKDDSK